VGVADLTIIADLVLTIRTDAHGVEFGWGEHPNVIARDEPLTVLAGWHG
jgi:hypothetical protein